MYFSSKYTNVRVANVGTSLVPIAYLNAILVVELKKAIIQNQFYTIGIPSVYHR